MADFRIDFSAVGVGLAGKSAQFQMLFDVVVNRVIILMVESELRSCRGLCFQLTLERFRAKLL